MAIIDTSGVVDSAIYLKARLDKNKVGSNYYEENLQQKRDSVWAYRSNLVDIEEELNKQIEYTQEDPNYTPIDVAIRHVKGDYGKDLGTDWADIAFRNLRHFNNLGSRYRFNYQFPDMKNMSEEDKKYKTCIWIAVNKSPLSEGNSIVIRRCNTALTLIGSPTREYDNVTEVREEPAIMEDNLKYINLYYNLVMPVPQAEWYVTLQANYFTNQIKINDRFVMGNTDTECINNNSVYRVKAVSKVAADCTFLRKEENNLNKIPLIILGLDKDLINSKDDFETSIAETNAIYKVVEQEPAYEYYIELAWPYETTVLIGQTQYYIPQLLLNQLVEEEAQFSYSTKLLGSDGIEIENDGYYEFSETNVDTDNGIKSGFSLKNLKQKRGAKIEVTCTCIGPSSAQGTTEKFYIKLGGYY